MSDLDDLMREAGRGDMPHVRPARGVLARHVTPTRLIISLCVLLVAVSAGIELFWPLPAGH